ncbi:MAG: GAF domain-containing protein, partial [Anaerolineae bacterium]
IWANIMMRRVGMVIEGSVQDVTEAQERTRYLAFLADITRLSLQEKVPQKVLRHLAQHLQALFFADSCYLTRFDSRRQKVVPVMSSGFPEEQYLKTPPRPAEGTLTRVALQEKRTLFIPNVLETPYLSHEIAEQFPVRSALVLPLQAHGRDMGAAIIGYHQPHVLSEAQVRRAGDLAAHLSLVLSTAELMEETRQRLSELESVRRASLQVTSSLDLKVVLSSILEQIYRLLQVDNAHIFLYDGRKLTFGAAIFHGTPTNRPVAEPREEGLTARVARSGEAILVEDVSRHPLYENYPLAFSGALAGFPLQAGGEVRGVLNVAYDVPHAFEAHEIRILELLADQAAIAIQNAALYERVQRGYRRLQSLQTIDNAITASMDIQITLGVFLKQVIQQLSVDAAAIALYNPITATLEYTLTQGIPRSAFPRRMVRLGTTLSGKVALHKEIHIEESFSPEQNALDANALNRLPRFYAGIPLVAKGELQGVLDIYHYHSLQPDQEWMDFARSLATQAAIALENARLFNNLQRSNFELELAYDQTLEGWARALELRGVEPEGHTSRVVELCMLFAQRVVFDANRLLAIRRGAILHDIGKIAVSDAILLKPGPLDDTEWQIVRQHPVFARQLLSPIGFLRNAIDIPYAHHERWDGTGYPQGLRGERIPLGARIFALVDVWDSLTSERPYRPAWPPEKALAYIEEQAGRQFDPGLTPIFIDLLQENFRLSS